MRSKRVVLSIAVIINAFMIYSYFSTLITTGNRSANGFGAVFLILFLGIFNTIIFIIYYRKRFPLMRAGLLIAVLPIISAFLYSVIHGGSMFNEGSGSGGYLWLLIVSMPVGFLLFISGLIVKLVKRKSR